MIKNVGFIGLGVMGYNIALHIINANRNVHIIKRNSRNTLKFIKKFKNSRRLFTYDQYDQLSNKCDFIISCVGKDLDLKDVYLSKNGILKGLRPKTLIVDHTTASYDISKLLYKKTLGKKCYFFDAPISGGEIGAINGTLSIMVGGKKSKFTNLKEILDLYSKSLIYMGLSGSGQLTKMVNQICVATIIQGLAEGLNFAKKKKLKVDSIIKVLKNGAGQSWQLENRANTMWKSQFNFGFMNKLMLKDLDIIIKEINQSDIRLPVTKIIRNNYRKLIKLGFEKEDTSNLIRLLM